MEHNFFDIEFAFESVSSQMQSSCTAFVSRATGVIYYLDDGTGIYDELPEDFETSEDYFEIPHKSDLDLGVSLVHGFVADRAPELAADVREIFSRKGAYARYKSLLSKNGLLDSWHAHEQSETESALKQWCEDNGINLAPPKPNNAE